MELQNIPVMILAGGKGTRLGAGFERIPKPMLLVGDRPLLWHIMKYYASFGFRKFILCLGHQRDVIKDYFLNFKFRDADCTVNIKTGAIKVHAALSDDWDVVLADTGEECMTGGRIVRASKYLDNELFMLTYGDGLATVDLAAEVAFHLRQGRLATVTGVRPASRFGIMETRGTSVMSFKEKVPRGIELVNGGFFVMQRDVLRYFKDDELCDLAREPLQNLARDGQLSVFEHNGFWHCVDTIKDLTELQSIWHTTPPWRVWEDEMPTARRSKREVQSSC